MIDFYTWGTPNGRKVSIALEEMQLPYALHLVELKENIQKEPWFLAINPNGRIPAIVDRDNDDFAVFESGACLVYLAELSGLLLPTEGKARSLVMQWLMWQMGGLGPMRGQANVFFSYFPEKLPLVIARYQAETRRLLCVMNDRLATNEYLAGDYSIADIACWPWVNNPQTAGISMEDLPHLSRWHAQIGARPAVTRGMQVPPPLATPDLTVGQSLVAADLSGMQLGCPPSLP